MTVANLLILIYRISVLVFMIMVMWTNCQLSRIVWRQSKQIKDLKEKIR